jgi:hypothetical protein
VNSWAGERLIDVASSNFSFTAKFRERKPPDFTKESQWLLVFGVKKMAVWDRCAVPMLNGPQEIECWATLIERAKTTLLRSFQRTIHMPSTASSNITTADALTLLLHNQHALGAAIEEITHWISGAGAGAGADEVADNATEALQTLDANANAITEAIMRLRQS